MFKLLKQIICIFLFPVICFAHGVTGTVDTGGIVVTALYDDGEPFNYAKTQVLAPDADLPFSSGWTDRNGRFCFYPDVQGEYIVIIKDGMGHQLKLNVPATAAHKHNHSATEQDSSIASAKAHRPEKIMLGVSIILFLFSGLFWWKGNRTLKKA